MRSKAELFPGFLITQDDKYFKLGQDSALLSDFLRVRRSERAVDLGCGCGALSILALIRNSGFTLDGVELEHGAAELCSENIAACGFADRARCLSIDLRELPTDMYDKYDVCMSNPPYFSAEEGKIAVTASVAAARSEVTADIFDVCATAGRLLKWGGRFYVCYKPERFGVLMQALAKHNLEPKTLRFVHQTAEKEAILVMVDARKGGGKGMKIAPPLIVCEQSGQKTEEYKNIYVRRNDDDR